MGIFGGAKFAPKRIPERKSTSLSNLSNLTAAEQESEFGLDIIRTRVHTGSGDIVFADGKWLIGMLFP